MSKRRSSGDQATAPTFPKAADAGVTVRTMGTTTTMGAAWPSSPLSLETATGASTATLPAAWHGSGSTGTKRESWNWTR